MAEHGGVVAEQRAEALGGDYRRLLAGAGASNLGDGVRLAALPLLAVTLTDEAVLVSGVAAATFLPAVLLGPLGGVVIDRYDRRRLLLWGQLLRALAAGLFVLLLLGELTGIWGVYALALVLGAGEVVVDGASQAAIPTLVPRGLLERANARMITAQLVLDNMVGAALGGILFAVDRVLPFVLDAVTFLLGAGAVSRIRRSLPPRTEAGERQPATTMREEARIGFAFLRGHTLLRRMAVAIGITNLGAATAGSVLVLLVVDELGANEASFGLVLSTGALVGLVASAVGERIVRRLGRATTFVAATVVEVLALVATAFAPDVLWVAATFGLESFVVVMINIPGRAVRQEVTPEHLLGRVVSSYRVIGYLGVPLGAVLGGVVTDLAGVRTAFVVAPTLVAVAVVAMVGAVRHLPEDRTGGAPTPPHPSDAPGVPGSDRPS